MEIVLGAFCTILALIVLFNTILLIGLAGSLAKLIKYFAGEEKPTATNGQTSFVSVGGLT
jgi:hypothetical protein